MLVKIKLMFYNWKFIHLLKLCWIRPQFKPEICKIVQFSLQYHKVIMTICFWKCEECSYSSILQYVLTWPLLPSYASLQGMSLVKNLPTLQVRRLESHPGAIYMHWVKFQQLHSLTPQKMPSPGHIVCGSVITEDVGAQQPGVWIPANIWAPQQPWGAPQPSVTNCMCKHHNETVQPPVSTSKWAP